MRRRLRPVHRRLRELLNRLLVLLGRTAPTRSDARYHFQTGRTLELAEDWEGAASHYRAAVRANEEVPRWLFRLGRVLEKTEGWAAASEAYESAVALVDPPRAAYNARLALAYRTQGMLDEADEVLARALEGEPENRQLLVGSAEVAMARQDWPVAWRRWQRLDALGSGLPPKVLVRMSRAARQVRAYEHAYSLLDRAITADGGHKGALTEHANLQHRRMVRHTIGQEPLEPGSKTGSEGWRSVIDTWSELEQVVGSGLKGRPRDHYREAQLYLVEELLTEGRLEAASRAIEGVFRKLADHGAAIPQTLRNQMTNLVVEARSTGTAEPAEQQQLIDELVALPGDVASPSDWLVLYELALWNGLWQCAAACRERAVKSAQIGAIEGRSSLVRGVRAAIDQGHFGVAAQLLQTAERHGRQRASITWLRAHYLLSCGEIERSRELLRDHISSRDEPFADYVRGRSIAVVGPAPSGRSAGEEIDGFDIVVRCNYRGADRMPDPAVFGSRTDVSYFNDTDSLAIGPERTAALVDELDHAVLKSITRDDQQDFVQQGRLRNFRVSRELVLRTPNSIQNVLLDLHRFEPSQIKVFHANLFLSDEPYFATYRPDRPDQSVSLRQKLALGLHDPLSQLTLTRNLWRADAIAVDRRLADVLSLTNDGYMASMQETYGGRVLPRSSGQP